MSSNIRFYHLTATPLERALPKLLEKAREADFRILVKAVDAETVKKLDALLWSYDPASFLAHGADGQGNEPEQPILLSTRFETPNGATLLAITDGSMPDDINAFERVLDLFDGADETAVKAARERWKTYRDQGAELEYWQQTEKGGWQKKAG